MSTPPGAPEVRAEHLLRAALDDELVAVALAELGVSAPAVRLTLERRWLDAVDLVEAAAQEDPGVSVAEIAQALDRMAGQGSPLDRRPLSDAARAALLGALRERILEGAPATHAGHVLLGLMRCRDPLVGSTLAHHGLRLSEVRVQVRRLGRGTH